MKAATPIQPKRKNTGITILPSIRDAIADQARAEDHTSSRLIEVVMHWALEEMKRNRIHSSSLKHWRAVPPDGNGG